MVVWSRIDPIEKEFRYLNIEEPKEIGMDES